MAGTTRRNGRAWIALAAACAWGGLVGTAAADSIYFDGGPVTTPNENFTYEWGWSYTTATNDPNNIAVNNTLDSQFSGVGRLSITNTSGSFLCSGSLMGDRRSVLTAAHCVTDVNGVFDPTTSSSVTFQGPGGSETLGVTNFEVHPDWDGDFIRGNDLAVLTLDGEPTNQIADYALFTGSNETDAASVQKVGFGRSGTGALGDTVGAGTKRAGLNTYDAVADTMLTAFGLTPVTDFVPGSVLKFDFDNGLVGQDAFDFFFNIDDLGLGLDEVMSAPGDSGGPTFIEVGNELLVAGVTSYGFGAWSRDGLCRGCTGRWQSPARPRGGTAPPPAAHRAPVRRRGDIVGPAGAGHVPRQRHPRR